MTLKEGLKVVAVVAALLFVLAGIMAAAGVYWWQHNGDQLLASSKVAQAQGTLEGASLKEKECLDQALNRHRGDVSLVASVASNLRLHGCLTASRKSPGFCAGVPPLTHFTAAIQWRLEQCNRLKLSDPNCGNLFGEVETYCDSPARKGKPETPAQ